MRSSRILSAPPMLPTCFPVISSWRGGLLRDPAAHTGGCKTLGPEHPVFGEVHARGAPGRSSLEEQAALRACKIQAPVRCPYPSHRTCCLLLRFCVCRTDGDFDVRAQSACFCASVYAEVKAIWMSMPFPRNLLAFVLLCMQNTEAILMSMPVPWNLPASV